MTEAYRRWTPEEDACVRTMLALPRSKRARETARLVVMLDRTDQAIGTRGRYLQARSGEPVAYPRVRRAFSAEEDALITAVPYGSREAHWQALAAQLGRTATTLKHRRLALLKERDRKTVHRPDLDARFRCDIPVSEPVWFEHRITRDRLMAGR